MAIHVRKAARLAALMAISNYGLWMHMQDKERRGDLQATDMPWSQDPRGAVEALGGHFMESEEHEEMFSDEAAGWFNDIKDLSEEEVLAKYGYNEWIKPIVAVDDAILDKMRW